MKQFQKLKQQRWFELALAGCIVMMFYIILSHLGIIVGGLQTVLGYFNTIIAGSIIAYLINSPAKFFEKKVFSKVKSERKRWTLSVLLGVLAVVIFILLSMLILIPQLLESISVFLSNLPTYATSLHTTLNDLGLSSSVLGHILGNEAILDSSNNIIDAVVNLVVSNFESIMTKSASAGRWVFNLVIAFILSLYFLMDKANVKNAMTQLFQTLLKPTSCLATFNYFKKCDLILSRYVVFNIIDSLIVGTANAIFQAVVGIPYVGLISFVVAITNLIPTFGPVIGAVIGGFILLMVNPIQVVIFLIFTLILQTCDGYVIKPRLFGSSLGVSGMLIIVGVIVGGQIGGIAGILLATPFVAILDFTWRELIFPKLKNRRVRIDAVTDAALESDPAEKAEDSVKETSGKTSK